MATLLYKILGMIIPFLREAFLNRNKFRRNKTLAILVIVNIISLAAFFFAGDVVFRLYNDNQLCKETMMQLEKKVADEKAQKETDIKQMNIRIEQLISAMEKNKK